MNYEQQPIVIEENN
jgi:hypothetical protein